MTFFINVYRIGIKEGMTSLISQKAKVWIYYILTLGISFYIFIYYVVGNYHTSYYDESYYWVLGKSITMAGLFNLHTELRTYLYPLIISLVILITDGNQSLVKIIMSILQYSLYVYTVFLIAKTAFLHSERKFIYYSILFFGLTNIYLISACTLFLTDLISTCLIVISFIYLTTKDLYKVKNCIIISCCLYSAVMIRPSSSLFLVIFLVVAIYRVIKERNYNVWKIVVVGILSLVIFYPQIYMNVTNYNDFTPLIHNDLYKFQTTIAAKLLKYGTVIIPDNKPSLNYLSPFINPEGTTIYELLYLHPYQFVVTFISHIFGLFDWGYVNTYVYDLSIKQKIIPSIYLYSQWFIILIGIVSTVKKRWNTILIPSILFSVLIYSLFMGTTTIESRFGFPVYMLLLFFVGVGSKNIIENIKDKKRLLICSSLFVAYCLSMFFGSYLIDMQTGRIHWF